MKVAVCLFVRNEAADIASWLAWYHLLGFDTCIVYDDDSTDGTWGILEDASRVQDIRPLRSIGDRNAFHGVRQDACYLNTIKRYGTEFEWIGFFDADEYLQLCGLHSIHEFLDQFPNAGSIGINWCCYGSSGHAFKPNVLPVEAYTWHSAETLPINRHVKTLLRLSSWQGKYVSMHCFDVAPEKALNPAGQVIRWSQTKGIIEALPDWGLAKVMHYQCRSMEHFLERLRRLPGLGQNSALWKVYDVTGVEDRSPLAFVPAMNAHIASYNLGAKAPTGPAVPVGTFVDKQRENQFGVLEPAIAHDAPARPIVHVGRLGNLANHMIQYMTALKLASALGNCAIAGIDLPEWGIDVPSLPISERSLVIMEEGRVENVTHGLIDFDGIEALIRDHKYEDVCIMTYCQNVGNLLSRDFYNAIFVSDTEHIKGYGDDILVCNIRGGDILDGHHGDYVLLPIEYYKMLVETTGLNPVFFGQISENPYIDELRRAFPMAPFVPGTSPIIDFEILRRSCNIAICVSTFSWLAAWLSQAKRIFMPLTGLFNPFQHSRGWLVPVGDTRYKFDLFPANYAVSVEDFRNAHDPLRESWRPIAHDALEHLLRAAPRHARNKDRAIEASDEDFYLNCYRDIATAVADGRLKCGLDHFITNGFSEHRSPLFVDERWYTRTYPQAALEIGRGEYEDPTHHYAEVGALLGYLPCKPISSPS
jgi:hypothetical protein